MMLKVCANPIFFTLSLTLFILIISFSSFVACQCYNVGGYWGALVAQSVERWTCDWKVAGSNSRLEGPCGTVSIFSAPCAVPVFQKRHNTQAPSQSPNGAGSLN